MSERKYELNELSELYYQGFFKNTKIGQKIDDKLDAYSDKVLKEHEKELINALHVILAEEGIPNASEYYKQLIDDKRLTRVNTAIFAFVSFLRKYRPDMVKPIGRNKEREKYLDLTEVRLQRKSARDLFSELYELYQTFYTRNRFPYLNQRLFLEKLSAFPYYFKKDEDKTVLNEHKK